MSKNSIWNEPSEIGQTILATIALIVSVWLIYYVVQTYVDYRSCNPELLWDQAGFCISQAFK